MAQTEVVERVVPSVCRQKSKKSMKNVKVSKSSVSTVAPATVTPSTKEKKPEEEQKESTEVKEEDTKPKRTVPKRVEEIKRKRREERLAKEKQAEEAREQFVKEAAEKRAAERAEIIKQAKRLILYRKPLCRRINQGLIRSECVRELDAQVKFQETIKEADREEEMVYVKLLKEDVAKYEEEEKQKAEDDIKKRKNYGIELKKQIEEIQQEVKTKETEEFEAEKQDQINTVKYLMDAKEYEIQKLLNKKQKLNQFFKDAIEEKKQFDLKMKYEDAFEDRAIEIYNTAQTRIKKLYKEMMLKETEERKVKAEQTAERFGKITATREDAEERNFQKAVEEREAQLVEKERMRKERELRLKKELQDFQKETEIAKAKLLQEDKDLKTWEVMQRFKKDEFNKEMEIEEWKRLQNKKLDYAKSLKKYISENEAEREQEKRLVEAKALDMKEMIDREHQNVLNYAEEVLNESRGVRPLYPILKAVEDCKKELGLLSPKKREEVVEKEPKRKRRIPRVCTKLVPEDQICYLK